MMWKLTRRKKDEEVRDRQIDREKEKEK